ncbi:succinate dehydrogenase assembly factor 2 [Sphingomonas sp.]|uniref:FAD assembly factor SdhE n=1 Tax=Sphingomonas sp. TaxID=28214 RepID=UPI003B008307
MDREHHIKRLRFRAWHRGTKEADLLIGGFFDRHHADWDDAAVAWFAAILEEDDVDVMAWAIGTQQAPARYEGAMMHAMRRLDYIAVPR